MTTQLFKAKDVRSAIGMVTEEFGDEAIILSTKKNNGIVEIEASNNNEILTSFPRSSEDNKVFSKIFLKKLDEKNYKAPQKEISKTENKSEANTKLNNSQLKNNNEDLKLIKNEILELKKQISGMILTNESNICEQLSASTPIKLRQDNFSPALISKLNYSYQGKNLEEGKISFFRELSKKISSNDFDRVLKSRNIFVFGNSGSGKSTLVAKLASYISDARKTTNINFIDVSNTSTNHSETLRGYSRVLGLKMKDFNSFNFNESSNNNVNEINIFDFSGDLNFSLKKINEITNMYKSFNFCSILALQSGSNSAMINEVWSKVSDIKPMIAITKLDECWTGAEEISAIALNKARIGIFTGTKVLIDSILPANENSLTKYMKENFKSV
ncbi:GTP-binding protein [Rickettsiales bacterium]|nr:GTP-binding protein [Rickettsiales bacterium]